MSYSPEYIKSKIAGLNQLAEHGVERSSVLWPEIASLISIIKELIPAEKEEPKKEVGKGCFSCVNVQFASEACKACFNYSGYVGQEIAARLGYRKACSRKEKKIPSPDPN